MKCVYYDCNLIAETCINVSLKLHSAYEMSDITRGPDRTAPPPHPPQENFLNLKRF